MNNQKHPVAVYATDILPRKTKTNYPAPFAGLVAGREKRQLGDFLGLTIFGVNLTRLAPNAISALRHSHSKQDEFIYILQGCPTLHDNSGKTKLAPGMCAGFPASGGNACNLINETDEEVVYLEVGDRTQGDEVNYPDDDLQANLVDGKWRFSHKDGTPYE